MPNMTIAVPAELKAMLDRHPEMNWSAVARQAWEKKIQQLEMLQELDRLTANSKVTDEDIEKFSDIVKRGMTRRIEENLAEMRKKAKKR